VLTPTTTTTTTTTTDLNTLALGEGHGRLVASTNHKHVLLPSGKSVVDGILYGDDIE